MHEKRAEKDLRDLWESLCRAGLHWAEEAIFPLNNQTNTAAFQLVDELPTGAKRHVLAYIRGFLRERGWRPKVGIYRTAVIIELVSS